MFLRSANTYIPFALSPKKALLERNHMEENCNSLFLKANLHLCSLCNATRGLRSAVRYGIQIMDLGWANPACLYTDIPIKPQDGKNQNHCSDD